MQAGSRPRPPRAHAAAAHLLGDVDDDVLGDDGAGAGENASSRERPPLAKVGRDARDGGVADDAELASERVVPRQQLLLHLRDAGLEPLERASPRLSSIGDERAAEHAFELVDEDVGTPWSMTLPSSASAHLLQICGGLLRRGAHGF